MANAKNIRVRILCAIPVDGKSYKPNQVVDFPAELAKALKGDGAVDDSKEAVAYCIDSGAEPVEHVVGE